MSPLPHRDVTSPSPPPQDWRLLVGRRDAISWQTTNGGSSGRGLRRKAPPTPPPPSNENTPYSIAPPLMKPRPLLTPPPIGSTPILNGPMSQRASLSTAHHFDHAPIKPRPPAATKAPPPTDHAHILTPPINDLSTEAPPTRDHAPRKPRPPLTTPPPPIKSLFGFGHAPSSMPRPP